ncbi:MAG TPA: CCA tRNA nucleotidyltransferase [Sedimentisphaerales bacterium]|jgi:poly(A) polymerase|nr:CCA tRNA nucleotidyltransferase [Sedimentisphaerales bacterium]HNU27912.1 CCA tRNA nucleotidyltransferase [Sedimentisphaerales bacterium]
MSNQQAAIEIIHKLQEHGFQALLAGGCVRDMLLGRTAKDYDVATDAQPTEVMRLFPRTLKIGAKFGVVIVLIRKQQVEVATFRSEAGYEDGRHPTEVRFTTAAQDASRRDFTINGMFYDPRTEQVIDYVEGRADLQRRIVRTIGNPEERFGEDYLRMLRAVRFSTRLGFAIEPGTYAAIGRNAAKIARISGERIAIELEETLVHPNRAAGAAMLIETGLADAVFPGFAGDEARQTVPVLRRLRRNVDFPLALAAFFVGHPTDFAMSKCEPLKLSNKQTQRIEFLLAHRGGLLDSAMSLAQLKKFLAEPAFRDLYELERAIQKVSASQDGLARLAALQRRIRDLGDVEVKPKPLLNGHDLMRLGAVSGPALGQLAEELYVAQLENDVATKDQAERWVTDWLGRHRSAQ